MREGRPASCQTAIERLEQSGRGNFRCRRLRESAENADPFEFLAMSSSPEDQLICTKQCLADQPSLPALWRGEKYTHDRIHSANRQQLLLPSEFFQSGELGKL